MKRDIAQSRARPPDGIGGTDDDNGYIVGVEVAHVCHFPVYGDGIDARQHLFDAGRGFAQPRRAFFGRIAVPKGHGGRHNRPVVEAAQRIGRAFESPVVDVKFPVEPARPYDVAQRDIQIGFDANVAPVFGHEFGHIHADPGNHVDIEFKTRPVQELAPPIAIRVAVLGPVQKGAG